jgi:helicase
MAYKLEEQNICMVVLSPFKALTSDQYQNFESRGFKVSRFDSDTYDSDVVIELSNVNIFTYEKFDSLLNRDWFEKLIKDKVSVIAIDEIHMITTSVRGYAIESIITTIKDLKPNMRFIGLSATIEGEKLLADFMSNAVIIRTARDGSDRPVKLNIIPKKYYEVEEKRTMLLEDTNNIPSMVFVFPRDRTEELAKLKIKYMLGNTNTNKDEIIDTSLTNMLNNGIAYHNAGVESGIRQHIENLCRDGKINYVVSTTTFGAGVNFTHFQRGVIFDTVRYSTLHGKVPIPGYELIQMAGRIRGRRGIDKEVSTFLYIPYEYFDQITNDLTSKTVVSNFEQEYYLRHYILKLFVNKKVDDTDSVLFFMSKNAMSNISFDRIVNSVQYLIDNSFLKLYANNKIYPTFIGRMTIILYINLETAIHLQKVYVDEKDDEKSIFFKVLNTPEFIDNVTPREEDLQNITFVKTHIKETGVNYEFKDDRLPKCFFLLFHKYMAKIIRDKYNREAKIYFSKPDHYILKSSAQRILSAGSIIGNSYIKDTCKLLLGMVKAEDFNKDSALLCMIKGLGTVRVERLNDAGIKTLTEFLSRSDDELAKIMKVTSANVFGMKEQCKKLMEEIK